MRDKSHDFGSVPSDNSDQTVHPSSLIRVSLCSEWVAKDLSFLRADSECSSRLDHHANKSV